MNEQNPSRPSDEQTPPPPSQQRPPAYYYGPPPADRRSSGAGVIGRLGGMIGLGLLIFFAGFYVAMFSILAETGPARSTFREGEGTQKVAIIPVNGMIGEYTSQFVRQVVDNIIKDESIGAVVLRVESPGGAVTASDEILHAINRLRSERDLPIVASYGGMAASGGYYISCDADRIFAQPTSITGSIGVILQAFTVEELLDKVGVEPEVVTSSLADKKALGSPLKSWTEEDRQRAQMLTNSIQDRFIEVVATGRSDVLSEEEVRALATGEIFTTEDALEQKLIDEVGYIDDALDHAVSLGDFDEEDPPSVIYRPRTGFLPSLPGMSTRTSTAAPTPARIDGATIRQWASELSVPQMMYLWQP